jgi:hypothetical protein
VNSPQARRLFAVSLSPATSQILTDVENAYGLPIREEVVENWEASHYGENFVDSNGTPVIRLNRFTGQTESTILHELLHLRMKAKGFPSLSFELSAGDATESNKEWIRWLGFHLQDPILHWMFYPDMRRLGVNPDSELEAEFEEILKAGRFPNLAGASEKEALILYYLKARLQLDSNSLLARIDEFYQRNGWTAERTLANRLFDLILNANPDTPEKEIKAFIECVNVLLQGRAQFRLKKWEEVKKGAFLEKAVVIQVLPP